MAHFLLVDDNPEICQIWGDWLLEENHTCQKAGTYREAVQKIWESEQDNGEPFDMILLDHALDPGFSGINVLEEISEELGQNYVKHRIIVITAQRDRELARDYSRQWEVSAYLLKPTAKDQFFVTIINALERRRLYVEYPDDWESVVEVLERLELLPRISQMERDLATLEALRQTHESLLATHRRLLQDLAYAGGNLGAIQKSYNDALEQLNRHTGTVESIIPFLRPFLITKSFWEDIKYTFYHERLKFYALQSYLLRIANNPNAYRVKHLSGDAPGHYEYRTGITHRLYFRRDGNHIILERFGHKNYQREILHFLHQTGGGQACAVDNLLSNTSNSK